MLMAGLTMVIIFVEEVGRAMGAGTVEVTCGLHGEDEYKEGKAECV